MPALSKDLAWDDFRLVLAIADAKGLGGAAERLRVDPSTMFRRLGRIETALGTPLFERHRTGYAPTAAGDEMARLAQRIDEEINAFTRKLAGLRFVPEGELRVTTSDTLLAYLLAPMLAEFRAAFPAVRLEIVVANQALNLSKRDADVAIRTADDPPETLVGRRVARIAWALYGRAVDFPEPVGVTMAGLAERPWVAPAEDLAGLTAARFARERIAPERVACTVNTVLGLVEAVTAGIGIGHLPCFIGDARPALVRLALPEPSLSVGLWLLTHADLRHAARVRAFLDFLAAKLAERRGLLQGELAPEVPCPSGPG